MFFWQKKSVTKGPITVTPIGSCRVQNALHRGRGKGLITSNLTGIYGFTHSSAEAVQLVNYLFGTFSPDRDTMQLLARKDLRVLFSNRFTAGGEDVAKHKTSDLYFIELADATTMSVDGVYLQRVIWTKRFAGFFPGKDQLRAYWQAVRAGNTNKRVSVLEGIDAFKEMSEFDKHLLMDMQVGQTDRQELLQDMKFLAEKLPKVVFVTHCKPADVNGKWKNRASFIDMVKDVADELGLDVFDPSPFVKELGEENVFSDANGSYSHYTAQFEDRIYQILTERYVRRSGV